VRIADLQNDHVRSATLLGCTALAHRPVVV
jgi:hypothetical protein